MRIDFRNHMSACHNTDLRVYDMPTESAGSHVRLDDFDALHKAGDGTWSKPSRPIVALLKVIK